MTACTTAGARIHLGFYTYPPADNAWNGLGMYLSYPRTRVCAFRGTDIVEVYSTCPLGDNVINKLNVIARKFGVAISVEECIPVHRGYGSTTQVLLAAYKSASIESGRGFNWIQAVLRLGRNVMGRVGSLLFKYGGLVIDGSDNRDSIRLYRRARIPGEWRIILVDPGIERGLSEEEEAVIWERMENNTTGVLHIPNNMLLDRIVSSAEGGDLQRFLGLIGQIDEMTGGYFGELQGGSVRESISDLVGEASRHGIILMQSSWGPLLYTITTSRDAEVYQEKLQSLMMDLGYEYGYVAVVKPRNKGGFTRILSPQRS